MTSDTIDSAPVERPMPPAPPRRGLWLGALTAGLLAGLIGWIAGERVYMIFEPTPAKARGTSVPPEEIERVEREQLVARTKEGAINFGVLGGVTALALGLMGGWARRNALAASIAAIAGLVLGSGVGTAAAVVLVRVFYRSVDPTSDSLIVPMLVHATLWASIGLTAGLAFGIGLGGRDRIIRVTVGAMLGAIGGALLCEVLGVLAFPLAKTHLPVSGSMTTRLCAHLALTLFIAAGVSFGVRDPNATADAA